MKRSERTVCDNLGVYNQFFPARCWGSARPAFSRGRVFFFFKKEKLEVRGKLENRREKLEMDFEKLLKEVVCELVEDGELALPAEVEKCKS